MDTGISVSSITRKTKLNSVAEMLNPAMLALNPEKYAAKMEAINTVYQNVKESREKMQQMLELNQQELERQLFEAEASWSEKLEKKADEFLEEACDYLKRSAECFFWGNFTEEVTLLGVGCQIAVGFTGVDLPFDVRDIIADIINLAEAEEWDWGLVGILLLDLCALLPVIGCLKYADEAAVLVKHADEAADLVKHADKLKYVDEAGELLTEGRKLADSGIKGLEDAVAEARKLEKELAGSKLLDDVVGGGTKTIKYQEIKTFSAEEVNKWFVDNVKSDYRPPYKPGTKVKEIELTEKTTFVRVYDKMPDGSGMYGSWVMKADDIRGLTPLEIQDKFALPHTPKYVCDVELEAGIHMRVGEVNPLDGWGKGGGIQYDLIGQRIGIFKNERILEGM